MMKTNNPNEQFVNEWCYADTNSRSNNHNHFANPGNMTQTPKIYFV